MIILKKILVIGNNVRSIVCSARKAGYEVYGIDYFGDIDMQRCTSKMRVLGKMSSEELQHIIKSFGDVDAVVLGPGFEHLKVKNALNNSRETMEKVGDKSNLPGKMKSMGIPHPDTSSIETAESVGFPLVIKPKSGSGGMKNLIVRNETEMNIFREKNNAGEFIAQKFVDGIPCSASIISTGEKAVVVALNEQLIGIPRLTRLPFAYCGNVTPLYSKYQERISQYALDIALELKLRGSNGIDFILTGEGIQVIEVNPRFQGSIDTVELSTGLNVFDAHVKSFFGELPEVPRPSCFAAKNILYSDREVLIGSVLYESLIRCMNSGKAADIPNPGIKVLPDEPITTMLATGRTRKIALDTAEKYIGYIKGKT